MCLDSWFRLCVRIPSCWCIKPTHSHTHIHSPTFCQTINLYESCQATLDKIPPEYCHVMDFPFETKPTNLNMIAWNCGVPSVREICNRSRFIYAMLLVIEWLGSKQTESQKQVLINNEWCLNVKTTSEQSHSRKSFHNWLKVWFASIDSYFSFSLVFFFFWLSEWLSE